MGDEIPGHTDDVRVETALSSIRKEHWSRQELWTQKEFVDLLCGLEPESSREGMMCEINEAAEQVRRAIFDGAVPYRTKSDATDGDRFYDTARLIRPTDAVEWATRDPKRFPKFPFNTDMAKRQPVPPVTELGTRERATVTKVIAGILLARYKEEEWEQPHKLAGQIEAALQKRGLNLSDDTIAKWVKRAGELFPAKPQSPPEGKRTGRLNN